MRCLAPCGMFLLFIAGGCQKEAPAPEPSAAAAPAPDVAAVPKAAALLEPKDPNEACAQIVSVAFVGAEAAPEGTSRDEAAAEARAEQLLSEARAPGADFRNMAAEHSDAASKVRRGAIGTFRSDAWPDKHGAVKEPLFALKVNGISDVFKAPYGFTFARRCAVEKVHTAHILIRYKGGKNAGEEITRNREEAQGLAMEIFGKAKAGGDFAGLAKENSEDGSAERGGDLGDVGRGLFVPPYEEAAFALQPGAVSAPVETKYGFHVIKRVD